MILNLLSFANYQGYQVKSSISSISRDVLDLGLRQIQLSALTLFYQNKPLGKLVSLSDGNGVHNQICAIIMKITNIINDLLLKVHTY